MSQRTPSRRVLEASITVLVFAVVAGWFLYPEHVAIYYTPSSSPDVVFPKVLALLLVPAGGVAFGFGALAGASRMLLAQDALASVVKPSAEAWEVLSSVLMVWATIEVLLVSAMGNDPDRAWAELAITLVAVVGLKVLLYRELRRMRVVGSLAV